MALSLFASIGLGFVISLASATDAQAVQYTMIILLASLFFSGFFLSIGQMEGLAQVISWLLPVSYGMKLLRDVMLRGHRSRPALRRRAGGVRRGDVRARAHRHATADEHGASDQRSAPRAHAMMQPCGSSG